VKWAASIPALSLNWIDAYGGYSNLLFAACSLADILGEVGSLNTSTQPKLEVVYCCYFILLIVACSLADILGEVGSLNASLN
jgi:hypothetical protein